MSFSITLLIQSKSSSVAFPVNISKKLYRSKPPSHNEEVAAGYKKNPKIIISNKETPDISYFLPLLCPVIIVNPRF
jgi:hypothetical protein